MNNYSWDWCKPRIVSHRSAWGGLGIEAIADFAAGFEAHGAGLPGPGTRLSPPHHGVYHPEPSRGSGHEVSMQMPDWPRAGPTGDYLPKHGRAMGGCEMLACHGQADHGCRRLALAPKVLPSAFVNPLKTVTSRLASARSLPIIGNGIRGASPYSGVAAPVS